MTDYCIIELDATDDHDEIKVKVEYDFEPGEPQSYWHPGTDDRALIYKVTNKGETFDCSPEELARIEEICIQYHYNSWRLS